VPSLSGSGLLQLWQNFGVGVTRVPNEEVIRLTSEADLMCETVGRDLNDGSSVKASCKSLARW